MSTTIPEFSDSDFVAIHRACFDPKDYMRILEILNGMRDSRLTIGTLLGEYRVGLHKDNGTIYFASVSKYEQDGMISGMQDKRQLDLFDK